MKKLFYLSLIIGAGCQSHKYEVHLASGTHHLITVNSEVEAEEFVSSQKDSHGTLIIKKVTYK